MSDWTETHRKILTELAQEIRESNDSDVRLEDADAIDAALVHLAALEAENARLRREVEADRRKRTC
jgi:hypothetical protein